MEPFSRNCPVSGRSAMVTHGHAQHPRASSVRHCEWAHRILPNALGCAAKPWTARRCVQSLLPIDARMTPQTNEDPDVGRTRTTPRSNERSFLTLEQRAGKGRQGRFTPTKEIPQMKESPDDE
jgi:hypothetical protein